MSKFFKFVIFGLVIYNCCRRHNPIFKHKRPSTFLTYVKDYRYLPVSFLVGVLVEVVVEFGADIRRNLCYQDEPGPENKTGQSIIRQR